MPLTAAEILVGAIAYFDAQALNANAAITKSGDQVTRLGSNNQFVCYKVVGATSFWAPLTGTGSSVRVPIKPNTVSNAYGALANGKVFLQDGKNTYAGPNADFVTAAANEGPFIKGRPRVSAAGVSAIAAAVLARGGQL